MVGQVGSNSDGSNGKYGKLRSSGQEPPRIEEVNSLVIKALSFVSTLKLIQSSSLLSQYNIENESHVKHTNIASTQAFSRVFPIKAKDRKERLAKFLTNLAPYLESKAYEKLSSESNLSELALEDIQQIVTGLESHEKTLSNFEQIFKKELGNIKPDQLIDFEDAEIKELADSLESLASIFEELTVSANEIIKKHVHERCEQFEAGTAKHPANYKFLAQVLNVLGTSSF